MLERILIVALIAVTLLLVARLASLWSNWRIRRAPRAALQPELAPLVEPGRPTVLAFTTPGCVECRTRQAPALQQLRDRMAERVSIIQLSAPEHPTLVDRFGILSVPATIVLDANGAPQHINLRFASADTLQQQVASTD